MHSAAAAQPLGVTLLKRFGRLDPVLFLITTALSVIGVITLYSAAGGSAEPWAQPHALRYAVALAGAAVLGVIGMRLVAVNALPVFAVALVLLIAVEFVGVRSGGAERWLSVAGMRLQPSEIMKIAVIVMMAKLYSDAGAARANHPLTLAGAAMIVALPTLLIVRQPDLGTAVLVAATGAGVAFVGGISWRIVLGSAVTAMIAIPLSVRFLLKDYQRERIATFLNPDSDPLGSGYQILQSKIALGSGGMEGKGFLQGTQGQLAYLPEMSTDFAFAMFAEEFGFLGAMTILGLFALLIVRGVMIALSAKDRFAQLVGLGCALNLSLYALVNIAMVSGMAPVVGVPLPFISYGGTAMLSAMICVGLLQAIHVSRRTEQVSRQGLL